MKQRILACLTAAVMAISLFITPIGSLAQGLTQATKVAEDAYGTISADDQAILKGMFDANYYRSNNPDLANLSNSELFKHFCEKGIFEGRTCNAYFDPSAYASAYPALKAQFGNDIMAYFRHYAENKNNPDFAITTLEACANAKITVTSLVDPSIVVTPEIYAISKAIGTSDYKVAKAAWIASQTGQPVEIEDEDGNVLVLAPPDVETTALMKAKGMTPIGVINYDNYWIGCYVVAGSTGYALYDSDLNLWSDDIDDLYDLVPMVATPNYVACPIDYSFEDYYGAYYESYYLQQVGYIEVEIDGYEEGFGNYMWVYGETYYGDIESRSYQTTGGNYIDDYNDEEEGWVDYYDPAGTDETEYNAVASIAENDDGSVTVAIGCYNDEEGSEFALVGEWTCNADYADEPEYY